MDNRLNLNNVHALVIDVDGVLWRGDLPLPGVAGFFAFLQRRGIPFVLATNNSTKTPAHYRQKLATLGVVVTAENILTSSLATAIYLEREFKAGAAVYVIGQDSLRISLQEAGFRLRDDGSQPADLVVVGGDPALTYDKLKYAVLLIQRGARFVGTNPDLLIPTGEGLVPEAGVTLAAVQAATGVAPVIVGKPERLLFDIAMERMNSRPHQTAVLGDRLETDILGGQRAGLKTILVTTGVDDWDMISRKGIQPDAVFGGLDELTRVWQNRLFGISRGHGERFATNYTN